MAPYTWIVWFKKRNFDVLLLEETFGLGKVKGGMVRRGVPNSELAP